MLIKYKINDINTKKRLIDVENIDIVINDDYAHIILTTKTPHMLHKGDTVLINRQIPNVITYKDVETALRSGKKVVSTLVLISGLQKTQKAYFTLKNNSVYELEGDELQDILHKYNANNKFEVDSFNFSDTTFSISCPRYHTSYIKEIHYGENDNDIIELQSPISDIFHQNDIINVKIETDMYVYLREEKWDDAFYECKTNPAGSTQYLGENIVKFVGSIYKWETKTQEITCKVINERIITTTDASVLDGKILYIEDNRFISNDWLEPNTTFYELIESIKINIPINSSNATELNDEDLTKYYFEERKRALIPEIIDNEKVCFTPYFFNGSEKIVSKIRYNIFLRSRDDVEEWTTNDGLWWNQYQNDENGRLSVAQPLTKGDLLSFLNFSDDDIYFRKKKVGKSFIRLLFYDSNDPFKQMLLFYSTIFLDSSDLYMKYIKNISKKNDNNQLVADSSLGDDNLTLSFTVSDKYDMNKSSEGFYLYLYPENIKDNERTIYMKVEFNHAGYGLTVPLIYPNNGYTAINFGNNFPESLMDANNGDLKEFYRQLYIPITIKYDTDSNDYKYLFNICEGNADEITINLYEPKINSLT